MPNILDEIPNETGELIEELGDLAEENEEKDTPSESSTDDKTDDKELDDTNDKKDEEENLPFHKHPRWKKVQDDKKELELKVAELSGKLDGLSEVTKQEKADTPPRPEWFTSLYGDDEELWPKVYKYEQEREERIKAELLGKIETENTSKTEAQLREEREALEHVNNSIQDLKDSGEKFDSKELVAVVREYQPTDDNGNLDFVRGLKMLKELKKTNPESSKAKKELADTTTSKSTHTNDDEPLNTTKSLRHTGW